MPEALRAHAAHQALGRLQRDGAHAAFADMLLGFANNIDGLRNGEAFAGDANGRVDLRDLAFGKLAVHRRPRHLHHLAHHHVAVAIIPLELQFRSRNPRIRVHPHLTPNTWNLPFLTPPPRQRR